MSFLRCHPSVFVIGDEYEILVSLKENGISYIEISDNVYYEENNGVLSSEKNYAKIRVAKEALNKAYLYKIVYRRSVNRKAYFSEMGDKEEVVYKFKPLLKEENINIYHIADVHCHFDMAKKTASYFGNDLDLLIFNGDMGEVETVDDYFNVIQFIGDISLGEIPIIFARGNHDTRGRLAELYSRFFPTNNNRTFYTFSIGCLSGVVLDCGEDKLDSHKVYSGLNDFVSYRKKETKFLKDLNLNSSSISFAISHICPMQTTFIPFNEFDISRDIYEVWNEEFIRIGIKFMLSAHMHKAYLLKKNSADAIIPNHFPVIFGSEWDEGDFYGCALTINKGEMLVKFTNSKKEVKGEYIVEI